jgi:hypothetical protein
MASSTLTQDMAAFDEVPQSLSNEGIAAAVCMRYLSSTVLAGLLERLPHNAESAGNILDSPERELDFLRYAIINWFVQCKVDLGWVIVSTGSRGGAA